MKMKATISKQELKKFLIDNLPYKIENLEFVINGPEDLFQGVEFFFEDTSKKQDVVYRKANQITYPRD